MPNRKLGSVSRYVVAEVVNRKCQQDAFIPRFLPESACNFGRHFGLAASHHQAKGYYHSKVNRYSIVSRGDYGYSNSDSTFQLIRPKTSGDISLNPGPSTARSKCQGQEGLNTDNAIHNGEDGESHLADLTQHLQSFPAKDLRVAHLNVCSLRNKMDVLRFLQLLCKFDMIAITETHLDKTVPDSALDINGMKLLRLDRKGRKGGGCALYFAEHLQATQRKDLHFDSLEGIWLHIKFPSSTALFAVMYRPPDADHFFDLVNSLLEKAWLKSSNIFLMGDFNCDFSTKGLLSANTSKLPSIFEMFNMENVIQEATRQTITSSSLIDLIVTTRKDLVSATGVFPLGISDHNLIYATIRLKNKRPPPIIVKTRDYKRMDTRDRLMINDNM